MPPSRTTQRASLTAASRSLASAHCCGCDDLRPRLDGERVVQRFILCAPPDVIVITVHRSRSVSRDHDASCVRHVHASRLVRSVTRQQPQ